MFISRTLLGLSIFLSLLVFSLASPRSAFAYNEIFGNISADTIWQAGQVYVINGNVFIEAGITVTAEPGTIIKFKAGASLYVSGFLIANGTSNDKIYFTSFKDDTVGGDTNGDNISTFPLAGDWAKIVITNGANGFFENIVIKYAGTWPEYAGIFQAGGNLNVSDSILESNYNSLRIAGGTTIARNNIFKNNQVGLETTGQGSLSLNNNQFINNSEYAAIVVLGENRSLISSGNTASGNGRNGTFIYGSMVTNQTWSDQMPYIISNSGLTVPSGVTLTLNPGTKIKFSGPNSHLSVSGHLIAAGTADGKVYFTSIADDSVGGDTNGDGLSVGTDSGWSSIFIGGQGTANFSHSTIRFGGFAWPIYSNIYIYGGNVNILKSVISDAGTYGLRIIDGQTNIVDTEITNNAYGIIVENGGGTLTLSNNSIAGNSDYGLYNATSSEINAENNWWGDASGPYNLLNNENGAGNRVSNLVDFVPWLTSPPDFGDEEPPLNKEPVIIIPGILGSRLNRVSDGEEVWPNSTELLTSDDDKFLDQLKLNDFGNEILDVNSTSILEREFLVFPFYENLLEKFEDEGYVRDNDLLIFDYDWRSNISSLSLELKQIIEDKAGSSPTGKVSIVAHSMGGVLTKEYLRQNVDDLSKINNVVIAGAPQLGSIKAFNLLNFGDNLNIPILNPDTAKDISQNMPSVYQLLPSQEYINQSGGYIEDHRNKQNKVLNYNETKSFMINDSRNESLLNFAEQFHRNLDSLSINEPKITNLVACNVKTLAGVKILDNKKADIMLAKGDGTVPLLSARQIFSGTNQNNYYAVRNMDHFGLVINNQALELISAAAVGNTIPSMRDIKSDDSLCNFDAKRFFLFSTHSPVNLRVYDEQGNYVGLNENGDVNIGIPESDFIRIGENNFVLVPEGQSYRAVVVAYDIGSFDFRVRVLSEDSDDSATYFNVPINQPDLNAELSFNGELQDIILNIDRDGNGSIDDSLAPDFIIYRASTVAIEDIIVNIEGAYRLGWIKGRAREYFIRKLELVDKLESKDESKDGEIQEILADLLIKLDDYLRSGLMDKRAYDIIKEDISHYISLD